jgi:hypothetical protein
VKPTLRIATTRPLPDPDHDELLLLEALGRQGIEARMALWKDEAERWDSGEPTLIRSPWDYIHSLSPFLDWVKRVDRAGPLWNPAAVVLENAHKRYLLELAREGLPVVPTWLIERGAAVDPAGVDLAAGLRARGWEDIVVKPAVGAGSWSTQRYTLSQIGSAQQHLAELSPAVEVLIQPYLRSVEGHGERAMVAIEGEFTHAVRKSPRFIGMEESVSEAVSLHADERELGERVLARYPRLAYARVDVARDERGVPMIMELELIEPSLFLRQNPRALERLALGMRERLLALQHSAR